MRKNNRERVLRLEVVYGDKELQEPQMISRIIDLLLECNTSPEEKVSQRLSS